MPRSRCCHYRHPGPLTAPRAPPGPRRTPPASLSRRRPPAPAPRGGRRSPQRPRTHFANLWRCHRVPEASVFQRLALPPGLCSRRHGGPAATAAAAAWLVTRLTLGEVWRCRLDVRRSASLSLPSAGGARGAGRAAAWRRGRCARGSSLRASCPASRSARGAGRILAAPFAALGRRSFLRSFLRVSNTSSTTPQSAGWRAGSCVSNPEGAPLPPQWVTVMQRA
ncbi:putative HTLV-1-related endogenous sequence [Loxodonta africana]|uniref:putative HTLV-1-related endogenous sequence n=1 Tax=Loxodonta africana TaxID=9785 RepID=UPI0030D0F272